jgi:hypothetical protein
LETVAGTDIEMLTNLESFQEAEPYPTGIVHFLCRLHAKRGFYFLKSESVTGHPSLGDILKQVDEFSLGLSRRQTRYSFFSLNSQMRSRPFQDKREVFVEHSILKLHRHFRPEAINSLGKPQPVMQESFPQ